MLLRPLRFEMKAMFLPSGDQVVAPTERVMYSLSMERPCWFCSTLALGLLVICLGSVMAWGAGRFCGRARVLIEMTNRAKERIDDYEKCSRGSCHPERSQLLRIAKKSRSRRTPMSFTNAGGGLCGR